MDLNQARFNMIEQQIRPWEVLDPQLLELLSVVRREDFVPQAHQALAFVDMEIPLGKEAGQVMLAPRVQARLVQDLAIQKTDKVLEIGTGSGFTTALLAHQAAQVLSYEIDADLARQATANLQKAGITPVVITGRDSAPLRKRLLALGIEHAHFGTEDKYPAALATLQTLGLDWSHAAAMGDDWPDLPVMRACAFACAPHNAHIEARAAAHFVTQSRGGYGAAREFCDLLLVASGQYARLLKGYCP